MRYLFGHPSIGKAPICGVVLALLLFGAGPVLGSQPPASVLKFIRANCLDCHDSAGREAGLDLSKLRFDLTDPPTFKTWVRIHDRVHKGEMPPADYAEIATPERQALTTALSEPLREADLARQRETGRVTLRRLNRVEYENTLRDLLELPHLEVADILPADATAHGFDKVGAALNLSSVQMSRYLEAADTALNEAMILDPRPQTQARRSLARQDGRFAQVLNKGREAVAIGDSVGLLRQPNTAQAPWTWGKIAPSTAGSYRVRMKTFGFIWDRGQVVPADRTHVVMFYAFQGSTKRPLATFDVPRSQDEAAVIEFVAYLKPGDQLEIWLATLDDRAKPDSRPLDEYTAPGVAVEWLEMTGPLIDQWPPASYRRLFDTLPSQAWTSGSGLREPPTPIVTVGNGKRAERRPAKRNKFTLHHVVAEDPSASARKLLLDFAQHAFRRPVAEAELVDYLVLVQKKLGEKYCFQEAMRIGYQAVLCSPEFIFLREEPGPLDDHALASRLSYFLWNSMPDAELTSLASRHELNRPEVLRTQVERMLADPKSLRFVEDFTRQWLDLGRITVTEPDEQLYPEFDRLLLDSMVKETHAYFREMLKHDLGASHLVASDFAMVNGRLAELYGIPNVNGVEMRRVPLPPDCPRGGFLTQASVLKVTANGTTTSPVTRGAWVLDRLLGQPAPPPPPNVPAIEPDVRGATTIREQLVRHRADAACAACHRSIDPPGFALESFDVIGGWRDRYRSLGEGEPVKKTVKGNRPVKYTLGPPVDASGQIPSGESFQNIRDFRKLLLEQEEQLARNLVEKLLVYATGAGIQFADRAVVEDILSRSRDHDFGLRTLIHEIVQSETFRRK